MQSSFSSLPAWFRRFGLGAWLVVRMVSLLIGAVWLLGTTASFVDPLITGFVIGAVAGGAPLFVDRLAAPLISAAVRIRGDLHELRNAPARDLAGAGPTPATGLSHSAPG